MKNYNNDEIIRFFEDAGYNNVEIIGNRLLFTTGEDVINWSIQEAINFIRRYYRFLMELSESLMDNLQMATS